MLVYYIGHGALGDINGQYYLAIRSTQEYDAYSHSITPYALAAILREYARGLRRFVIIDACFAGSAVTALQGSGIQATIKVQENNAILTEPKIPAKPADLTKPVVENSPGATRGTARLCASANDVPAKLRKADCTYFTDAFVHVLRQGVAATPGDRSVPKQFSLRKVQELVAKYIVQNVVKADQVIPQVHSPKQYEGEMSPMMVFFRMC